MRFGGVQLADQTGILVDHAAAEHVHPVPETIPVRGRIPGAPEILVALCRETACGQLIGERDVVVVVPVAVFRTAARVGTLSRTESLLNVNVIRLMYFGQARSVAQHIKARPLEFVEVRRHPRNDIEAVHIGLHIQDQVAFRPVE